MSLRIDLSWRQMTSDLSEDVTYELRPLDTETLGALSSQVGADPENVSPQQLLQFFKRAESVFPKYVRNIRNVTIVGENGQETEATPEQVCTTSALIPLASEIVARLVSISQLNEEDLGNSGRPPGSSSTEPASGNPTAAE